MDIQWQDTIQINRPVAQVYAYLADFPRHVEWAQTLARMEQVRPGHNGEQGAQYRTYEKQAMQTDRQPGQKLTKGLPAVTLCTVDQVEPNQRIVWHAHSVPKLLHNKLVFDFAADGNGGTLLTQRMDFHIPAIPTLMFQLMFGRNLPQKAAAQAEAGLRNIKTIMEQSDRAG
ncbi:MAG: SRPBCC family protein [Anaerolineaceae bacterium]|nr:SRPBCC family protein [Anaerolineaceae bacterium]MCB9140617.1 SRPBCC family protein [Caldilineaceae bacterium]